MAVAEINNIVIEKGTDFEATFNIFNDDSSTASLSGASAVGKIRKYPTAPTATSFSTTINIGLGCIIISLTKEQTASLISGRNYFDIFVTKNNKTFKVLRGTMIVEESSSV